VRKKLLCRRIKSFEK